MKILFDNDTFGITLKSLKKLRNTLAEYINDKVAVYKVNTGDITCGFVIVNHDKEEIVFTGDGFRHDGGGEGGAGYNSARALLTVYGITPWDIGKFDIDKIYDEVESGPSREQLLRTAFEKEINKLTKEFIDTPNIELSAKDPYYVRCIP